MSAVVDCMRDDWNRWAREDARFFIACVRRAERSEDFAAGASEVVRRIRRDIDWLPLSRPRRERRFLEIGCGIGRLMRPLASDCGEIHGVDISDEMVRLGRDQLCDLPHAQLHVTAGSDLDAFADRSCDFLYSFAVMQHLPDVALFWRYWREVLRVLRPEGVLALHFNSTQDGRTEFDSWAGITVPADAVLSSAAASGLRIRSLEGAGTQYTWLTAQKPADLTMLPVPRRLALERIERGDGEPTLVAGGPLGHAAVFVRGLRMEYADLVGLSGRLGGRPASVSYIAPVLRNGARQVNLTVPPDCPEGAVVLQLLWRGYSLTEARSVLITRYRPPKPAVGSVTDGVELALSGRIRCGWAKAWVTDLTSPTALRATIGGWAVPEMQLYCEDPAAHRYQINLRLPEDLPVGPHRLEMAVGDLSLGPVDILVEAGSISG
jgi:SAM-dependent methyltransferase